MNLQSKLSLDGVRAGKIIDSCKLTIRLLSTRVFNLHDF
jgi:hypothetical protein